LQRGDLEPLGRLPAGEAVDQRGQQVTLHRQLLLQWRQCRLRLRQGRLDRRDIRPRNLAELELLAQYGERVGLDFDDLLGRRDLASQGRLLNRRGDDDRGQARGSS
jgi:hypothetical protein